MDGARRGGAGVLELDRASWMHPFTSVAEHLSRKMPVIVQASGVHVYDDEGRPYLDAMSGLWCVNVGYGRREIVEAIEAQARKLPFFHGFGGMTTEPAARLADRILELVPMERGRVFFGTSGSDSNETLIKLVWYYNNLLGRPRKKKILSRRRAYHGVTLGASSATGLSYVHENFDLPLPGFLHLTPPYAYREAGNGETEAEFVARLALELEETIEREDPETVAAFIAEPVMGAGGVIVPPEEYFDAIVPILRKHDVLLASDEVITGFGRLGTWFGSERYGFRPDLMTIAKGLTSGYVPLSACVISEPVFNVLRDRSSEVGPFAHGYTYSGHPVAAAAALANLDILESEKLVEAGARVGGFFQEMLRSRIGAHALVGEVRGIGMIAGIELVADRETREPFPPEARVGPRALDHLLERGVMVRTLGNTIALSPPLIFTRTRVEELVAKLEEALDHLAAELGREKLA
jgi:L-2,4-diaminobutyrate transaminase